MKNKKLIGLILNIINIILEIIGLVEAVILIGGAEMLIYYTQQSNILLLISSILYVIGYFTKKNENLFNVLKYCSVAVTTQTFLVSLFLLTPNLAGTMGLWEAFKMMFLSKCVLYHHFLCPVIGIISLLFFEEGNKLSLKNTFHAMIYTITYAVVYIILNILKVIEGPYFFLMVYAQPVYMSIIWCIVVPGIAYGICVLLRLLFNKTHNY